MFWSKGETMCSVHDEGKLRMQLTRLGVELDLPELVRCTSSTSSLGDSNCETLSHVVPEKKEASQSNDEFFLKFWRKRPFYTTKPRTSDGASFLEVLEGVNRAVEEKRLHCVEEELPEHFCDSHAKENACDAVEFSVGGNACTIPQSSSYSRCLTRRRTICPGQAARSCTVSKVSSVSQDAADLTFRGNNMQTFPETSFRLSKFTKVSEVKRPCFVKRANSDRSVRFSPSVHVLEYERDVVQYSNPDWSQYFS